MPPVHSAIVLVIDRLGAGFLGPYGNTWLETPGFNRLASQSVVCEHLLASSPDLATTYRSYWQGADASQSLPQLARQAGCHAVLVTDDESIAKLPGAADFDEIHQVKTEPAVRPAEEIDETAFIRLLDAALAQLESWKRSDRPQLLWIHARAMNGSWDAPLELRLQFADEDDPTPAEIVEPPQQMLAKNHDPDELLRIAHAYAGQVSVVDSGLQALLAAIEELPQRDSMLFAMTSPRGYPLGEHLRLGECDQALYGELLHVPCCIRLPQGEGALLRVQELCQPADLFATIADGAGWTSAAEIHLQSLLRIVRGEPAKRRDYVLATAGAQQLVRTSAWQLRIVKQNGAEQFELYAKPDDRWEFNDVASRAGDIVAEMAKLAEQPAGEELPAELTSPWR